MTKIALIVHAFPSLEHPYIVEWARGLARVGVDLTIVAEQASGQGEAGLANWVRVLNSVARPHWPAGTRNLRHIPRAFKILRAAHPDKPLTVLRKLVEYLPLLGERFDVVHFNAPQIATRRFELGRLLGARTLVSFRGQDFSFDAARFRPLLTQADRLHFISEHLIRLAKEEGYEGGRHTLIPPMVDVVRNACPEPSRRGIPQAGYHRASRFNLFSAARFSWTKGWEFALQAVAILVERGWDVEYNIAGDGEMKDAILYTIHALNLQERVHLLGWLSPDELRSNMQAADLYAMSSVNEGFNNSVLQAQACGLPVVCSDAGGLPENISDGETGLLFRRRDAWDMADKIESLLSNPDLRARMSSAGRERAEMNFSMQSGVQAFVSLYREMTG